MLTTQTGMLTRNFGDHTPLFAVRYDREDWDPARESRFNWADSEAGRDAFLATARAQSDAGEYFPTYSRPEDWTFTPDAPADETPADEVERLARELRPLSDVDKLGKLRELVTARRDAERRAEQANAQRDAVRTLLEQAQAPISDAADERLAPIWKLAAQAADDNGFCPEYEKLCDSLGIPGRPRLRRGVVEVTLNVYAYAMGATEEEAQEAMERQVRERLESEVHTEDHYSSHDDGSITDVDITQVDASDVEVYN